MQAGKRQTCCYYWDSYWQLLSGLLATRGSALSYYKVPRCMHEPGLIMNVALKKCI